MPLVLLALLAACGADAGSDRPAGSGADGATDAPLAATDDAPADPAPTDPCQLVEDGHGPAGTVPLRVEQVVGGLEVPWSLAFLPDGGMLITERPGRLRRVTPDGALAPEPVLEVPVQSRRGQESGLLGLALHPDFAENRRFYLYETVREPGGGRVNRVVRYQLAVDGTSAVLDRVVLPRIPGAAYHDGGRLRFGPDGMLYVGTGDAREPDASQDPASLAGKVLRVTADGDVPADNPFPGSPAWVIGLRNTQGFGWDPQGRLVVADHGPSGEKGWRGHDEVNLTTRGENLGWPRVHGCDDAAGVRTPAITWVQANPPGGLVVYDGDAIPAFRGDVLVGALGSRHLQRLRFDDEGRVALAERYLAGAHGRLRDVVQGPDGALYVTTSNCDGRGDCGDGDVVLRLSGG